MQKMKEEVKRLLMSSVIESSEKLELIDAIQRLGVAYHFEEEIEKLLQQMYYYFSGNGESEEDDDDLHVTALRFRLLRQQGYHVPCGIYICFIEQYCIYIQPN